MPPDDALALAERDALRLVPKDAGLQMPDVLRVRLGLLLEHLHRRIIVAEADAARLRLLVNGLAARVATQSDLLTARAEVSP